MKTNRYWIWFSFIVFGGIHFFLIANYSTNIPDWDDYDAALGFLNHFHFAKSNPERAILLLSQHNEHRIVTDRIISLFDFWIFGKINFYHLILIGNFFLILCGYFLVKLFQKRFDSATILPSLIYSLPIPLLVFNLESYENFFWGMAAIQNIGVILFSFLSFYFIFSRLNTLNFALSVSFAILGTYTSGNGMVAFLVVSVIVIINQFDRRYIVTWFILMCLTIGIYFIGFHSNPGHPSPTDTILYKTDLLVPHFLTLLGNGLAEFNYELMISIFTGLVLLILSYQLFKERLYKDNPILFSFILFLIISCALTSLSRSGFGVAQALSMRYRIYSNLLILSIYLGFLFILKSRLTQNKTFYIFTPFIIVFATTYIYSLGRYTRNIEDRKKGLVHGIAALNEKNRNSYLSYPDQNIAIRILRTSDSLGIYKLPKLNYATILSDQVFYSRLTETNDVDYAFDIIEKNGVLLIDNGWAYIEGTDSYNSKTMVVLISEKDTLFFDTYQHLRPDVTAAKKSTDLNESGFSFFVPIQQIPKRKYRLGFLIIKMRDFPIEIKRSFELTPTVIEIHDSKLSKSFINEPQIRYHFDDILWDCDSLKLKGWCFFDGISSSSSAIKFMIGNNKGIENLFKPIIESRSDVSAAFHGHYDSSGFQIQLPLKKKKNSSDEVFLLVSYPGGKKKINITNHLKF